MAYDPFFGANPVVRSLEGHRGRIEQTRENSSRLAQSFVSIETSGAGEFLIPDMVAFECTFIERPTVSYGVSVAPNQAISKVPRATGGVVNWERTPEGFYVGAYIFVAASGSLYALIHDFVFQGVAMKDLPDHLLEM